MLLGWFQSPFSQKSDHGFAGNVEGHSNKAPLKFDMEAEDEHVISCQSFPSSESPLPGVGFAGSTL